MRDSAPSPAPNVDASADACRGCSGSCCEGVLVGITGYDAWRLANGNATGFDGRVTLASAVVSDSGAFRFDGGFAVLALAKNPLRPDACVFLVDAGNGVRRCGTYRTRPVVCRTYPMAYSDGGVTLRDDVACAPDAWDMRAIAEPAWRADLDRYAFECAVHERVVAVWNRSVEPLGFAAYGRFVMRVYAAIEASLRERAALVPAPASEPDRFFDDVDSIATGALPRAGDD